MDDVDDLFEDERRLWERHGDVSAVARALFQCTFLRIAPPAWTVGPTQEALQLLNQTAGKRGRNASPAARQAQRLADDDRHANVERLLREHREAGRKPILPQVCEEVVRLFPEQNITARTVMSSYRKLEKARRRTLKTTI